MERKRAILKIGNSGAVLCDEYGSSTGISLELMLGTGGVLEFELHSEAAGDNAILPDYPVSELSGGSYYFALDTACGNSDDPPLLIFSGVTLGQDDAGRSIMRVPLTGIAGQRLTDTLNGRDSVELFCELGGFDSDAKALFAWQFKVVVRSRVYSGNGSPSVVPDPAYYTAAQVEAVVARQLVFEFSADGISWHEVLSDGDIFMRARHGRGGIPSESFAVPSGKDGEPGAQGPQGEPGKDGVDGKDLMIPAGTVIMHAGNSVPDGYIICNGAEVSREIYAGLFAAIGETYGPGDGETTFTLPDFTGRFPEGGEVAGTVKNAGLPNILGRTNTLLYDKNMDGALYDPAWSSKGFNWDNGVTSENGYVGQMGFDASRSNPIYGSSDTVQPPALTMRFFIKY